MPGFNPNEPRDYHGRWTKMYSGIVPQYILDKMAPKLEQEEKQELGDKIDAVRQQGGDTRNLYMNEDGTYTEDRAALHQEIVDHFMKTGEMQTGTVYVLGGAPANGKSSLEESGFLGYPENIVRVNADDIKDMLPEYQLMLSNKDKAAAAFVHEESSYISKLIINRSLAEKKDFLIDSIADSGIEALGEKINKYKAAGNRVIANYVTLDTDLSLKLAKIRGKQTGRFVPPKYILDMNKEIPNLVPKLIESELYDDFKLWNTDDISKPRQILSQKKGSKATIHDQSLYDNFLAKKQYKRKR